MSLNLWFISSLYPWQGPFSSAWWWLLSLLKWPTLIFIESSRLFTNDLQYNVHECCWNIAYIFSFSFSLLLFSNILLLEILVPIFPQWVHWYSFWFISFSLVLSINTTLIAVFTVRLTRPYNYQIVFFLIWWIIL
jgi:hypothetical protein